jgi:hypothetical protein
MNSFEKFLNQLIQEGKININKSSVVVEFFCGCDRTAAKAISKYIPKIYYANDIERGVFDPRLPPRQGVCFPEQIGGMKVKPLICDALDVDCYVPSYDIGLLYRSLGVIEEENKKSLSRWLEYVKNSRDYLKRLSQFTF